MKFILALDQGTTSSRAIVFNSDGAIVASDQKETKQIYPQPGWLEHAPTEIWESQRDVAVGAIRKAGITTKDLAGIGLTNQRETTIVWDRKTGEPIANAIVWQDRRTKPFCDQMRRDGLSQLISERTGLVIDPYFSGTKVRWLLDNVSGARAKADRGELAFGTVDSWLIWKLTKGASHVTDPTNASRTMLFNIRTGDWDHELLRVFGIPKSMLPKVVPSCGFIANATDALSGIPISGIAGDQQSALFGQMCTKPGMVKNTYGTGCFLLMNVGESPTVSTNRLITTVACQTGTNLTYALEGSVFVAGAGVQWLRDGLGIIKSSSDVESLAKTVETTNGVYIVPAFSGLGAPYWDDGARGIITGITGGTTKAHIARATLEAMAYQTADLVAAMRQDFKQPLLELRVDGGASVNNLLMQFQADLLGIPVLRPVISETTALGAAYLAGLSAGVWKDTSAIESQWRIEKRFEPSIGDSERRTLMDGWHEAVRRSRSIQK